MVKKVKFMKISDSFIDDHGHPVDMPLEDFPTRYVRRDDDRYINTNFDTNIKYSQDGILEHGKNEIDADIVKVPKNTRIESGFGKQDKEPNENISVVNALSDVGASLTNSALKAIGVGNVHGVSTNFDGSWNWDTKITQNEIALSKIEQWKQDHQKTIHIQDYNSDNKSLNSPNNGDGNMFHNMRGEVGESVAVDLSSGKNAAKSISSLILGKSTVESFIAMHNEITGNGDENDPTLTAQEILELNAVTKDTIYTNKPGTTIKAKARLDDFVKVATTAQDTFASIDKTRSAADSLDGVIKKQLSIYNNQDSNFNNREAFSGYALSDDDIRYITLIKNRNTFNKKLGYIYIRPNQHSDTFYKNRDSNTWQIPFEFNPTISEGGYSANYQNEKLLNRLGAFNVYTGTDLSTLTIQTKYIALTPDDVDDGELSFTDFQSMSAQHGTDAWQHYWSNNRLETIELKYRSLVIPDLTSTDYLIKPPIIELHLANNDGLDADTVGDLYKYPFTNGSIGGSNGKYLSVSVALDGNNEMSNRYKKYVVTSVQINALNDGYLNYPSLYGRKYQSSFSSGHPMWHLTTGSDLQTQNKIKRGDENLTIESGGTRAQGFAGYTRKIGFEVVINCQEVVENYLDLVPDFKAYYNTWIDKEELADAKSNLASAIMQEPSNYQDLQSILTGDINSLKNGLKAENLEQQLNDAFDMAYDISKNYAKSNSVYNSSETCKTREYENAYGSELEGFNYQIGRYNKALDNSGNPASVFYFANKKWPTNISNYPAAIVNGEDIIKGKEFLQVFSDINLRLKINGTTNMSNSILALETQDGAKNNLLNISLFPEEVLYKDPESDFSKLLVKTNSQIQVSEAGFVSDDDSGTEIVPFRNYFYFINGVLGEIRDTIKGYSNNQEVSTSPQKFGDIKDKGNVFVECVKNTAGLKNQDTLNPFKYLVSQETEIRDFLKNYNSLTLGNNINNYLNTLSDSLDSLSSNVVNKYNAYKTTKALKPGYDEAKSKQDSITAIFECCKDLISITIKYAKQNEMVSKTFDGDGISMFKKISFASSLSEISSARQIFENAAKKLEKSKEKVSGVEKGIVENLYSAVYTACKNITNLENLSKYAQKGYFSASNIGLAAELKNDSNFGLDGMCINLPGLKALSGAYRNKQETIKTCLEENRKALIYGGCFKKIQESGKNQTVEVPVIYINENGIIDIKNCSFSSDISLFYEIRDSVVEPISCQDILNSYDAALNDVKNVVNAFLSKYNPDGSLVQDSFTIKDCLLETESYQDDEIMQRIKNAIETHLKMGDSMANKLIPYSRSELLKSFEKLVNSSTGKTLQDNLGSFSKYGVDGKQQEKYWCYKNKIKDKTKFKNSTYIDLEAEHTSLRIYESDKTFYNWETGTMTPAEMRNGVSDKEVEQKLGKIPNLYITLKGNENIARAANSTAALKNYKKLTS